MDRFAYFLLTLVTRAPGELIRVALKVDGDMLPGDVREYPMEPENRAVFADLLPEHVRGLGDIVEITEIFWIVNCG